MMAVEAIQKEDAFQIESQYTCAAVNTSKALHEWWKQPTTNKEQLSWFAHVLIVRLKACFPCKYKSTVLRRERMWGCYQRLRTANTFVKDWQIFISKSVGLKAFPAFYQSVTQHIFDKLIKYEHPIEICENDPESHLRPLTSEECCALRYVAGYTFRKVYSSIDLSTHPQKDVMMCLLMELVGDGVSSSSESERWMGMINRGGLWTINDQAYDIFLIMEEEIRRKYTLASNKQWCASTCSEAILRNDDLRFQTRSLRSELCPKQ